MARQGGRQGPGFYYRIAVVEGAGMLRTTPPALIALGVLWLGGTAAVAQSPVRARTDNGRFLRVGMSIMIEDYPYLDVAHPGDSHFVWFMSAADAGVLTSEFGLSHPPALGRVLLDNAIVLSQNAGFKGRVGLHAAAAGGDALLEVYARCGLLRLPPAAELPAPLRRPNDGRFYYADEAVAEALAAVLDARR